MIRLAKGLKALKIHRQYEKEYNGVVGILFTMEKPLLFALVHNQNTGNITFPGGARENNEDSSKKHLPGSSSKKLD